ncbi:oxidoreductase [Sparassis latifolia]
MFFKRKWDPRGLHCFVTGGSAGLGLSLAVALTKKGADVSIVARNEDRLRAALDQLEAVRQTPNQILKSYSFSVDDASNAAAALEAACEPHGGRCPDAMFLCAGKSRPGFFVEQDEESLRRGMDESYWAQAWSALVSAKRLVRHHAKGKIVFVSSFLGYMSLVGYSTYSPGKFAIRGLAESLQSELMLYDVDVHICFPGTIRTPGFEEENKIKPKVTLKLEESDPGADPDVVAEGLLRGVQKGYFHITYDILGNIFRASTCGSSPRNNALDLLWGFIGFIALPIWRYTVDSAVREHRKEHEAYLADLGFFTSETPEGAKPVALKTAS